MDYAELARVLEHNFKELNFRGPAVARVLKQTKHYRPSVSWVFKFCVDRVASVSDQACHPVQAAQQTSISRSKNEGVEPGSDE